METFTKLMSIVQNVPGMSCEPIENDQSSHNSNLSSKDQETIILSGNDIYLLEVINIFS